MPLLRHFSSLILGCIVLFTAPAQAQWLLDDAPSRLHFVSIKKNDTAEVHQFRAMNGLIDAQGHARLDIFLGTVDTGIEIRNQRMGEHLFKSALFPTATFTTQIEPALIEQLTENSSANVDVQGELQLAGQTTTVKAKLVVHRASATQLVVATNSPIILRASELGLAEGLGKLQTLAKLDMISDAVPVSFILVFRLPEVVQQ